MSIFEKRLILVCGKGGVGKSTITAAIAKLAADSGLSTLVCEIEKNGRIARLFDKRTCEIDKSVAKNASYLFVEPEAAMEEYLKIYLRFRPIYSPIVQSPVVNYFLQAAPGFRELLILGKIWWEVMLEEGRPKKHRWDLVIVDAPATGHGISFMGVAHSVQKMVRIGPIHNQAGEMVKTLKDPNATSLIAVCIPEEMPVNETVELINKSRNDLGLPIGPVIMNEMPPEIFPENKIGQWNDLRNKTANGNGVPAELKTLATLADMGEMRRENALKHVASLKEKLAGKEIIEVPYIADWKWDWKTVGAIAEHIKRNLDL